MKKIFFLFFSVLCLCSCNSVNKEKSIEITQNVAEGNYDAVLNELDESVFQAIGKDSLKTILTKMAQQIKLNVGDDLDYTFLKGEKKFVYHSDQKNDYFYTETMISGDEKCYTARIHYNPTTNKPISIQLSEPYENPYTTSFWWIAAILGIGVMAFNIFTIVKVKKSKLDRKWLMYLLIILLNTPYISSSPEKISAGISIIHILGFGFAFAGQYSFVKIGIPIGAFIAWYKMKKQKQKEVLENE
jgi:predicted transcriptional regulator with HTH domain